MQLLAFFDGRIGYISDIVKFLYTEIDVNVRKRGSLVTCLPCRAYLSPGQGSARGGPSIMNFHDQDRLGVLNMMRAVNMTVEEKYGRGVGGMTGASPVTTILRRCWWRGSRVGEPSMRGERYDRSITCLGGRVFCPYHFTRRADGW